MSFTQEQIKHIANLSRLDLDEANVERYLNDLNSIVGYIDTLNKIDDKELAKISLNTSKILPLRKDELLEKKISEREELLACSPKNKVNHSIVINNIMN